MDFIVMDLEWNNTYARKTKGFINEIIEIGAVKLDENLNFKDKFSCIIRPQIGKKLRGSVKELTNITNEDVRGGELFTKVFSNFRRWVSSDSIFLTWGDGDIRVLIDNYKYLNGLDTIPFLTYYADMQSYIQAEMGLPKSKQVGLSTAAQALGVDESVFSHHRALDDSLMSVECLKKVYSAERFKPYIRECNGDFYRKLTFKAHPISNINSPLVDKKVLDYRCEICSGRCEQLKQWTYSNQYFRSRYYCPRCDRTVKVAVRFKQYYDRIDIRKTVTPVETEDTEKKDENQSSDK